jgi:hypothetical protein
MKRTQKPLIIPEQEKSPFVVQLQAFIENQGVIIQKQTELIQQLKDEITRFKNQPPEPKIKPSQLENKGIGKKKRKNKKRPGFKIKTAQLQIRETVPVPLESVPEGAEFKGYNTFVVQNTKIRLHNTKYVLET